MEEIERQRFIDAKKREKEAEKAERDRIKAKLAADRAERGFAAKDEDPQKAKADFLGNKKVSAAPKLRAELRAIKNEHGDKKDAAFKALLGTVAATLRRAIALNTRQLRVATGVLLNRCACRVCTAYVSNIVENPRDPKFRRINRLPADHIKPEIIGHLSRRITQEQRWKNFPQCQIAGAADNHIVTGGHDGGLRQCFMFSHGLPSLCKSCKSGGLQPCR